MKRSIRSVLVALVVSIVAAIGFAAPAHADGYWVRDNQYGHHELRVMSLSDSLYFSYNLRDAYCDGYGLGIGVSVYSAGGTMLAGRTWTHGDACYTGIFSTEHLRAADLKGYRSGYVVFYTIGIYGGWHHYNYEWSSTYFNLP
ncbi:hypothetical protein [Longispora albida]|uniref:hypothetical protein n=1 Tax=Longispora albida TaxID=203523 RepID=UPI000375BD2B|nr:hypothetical protein [Longispora albida]